MSAADQSREAEGARTPLYALHRELGGKVVNFAGYALPVQYPSGILAEHRHTREQASLFDVSHMGQIRLPDEASAAALESLVPADLRALAPGRMRYTQFTNDSGGILDDLMATRWERGLTLVVNAARKASDLAHLKASLRVPVEEDRAAALLALQGPAAASVLARFDPAVAELRFMQARRATLAGTEAVVSRSGYTGEDGFEISLPGRAAEALARALLAEPEVRPAGLGARDSLRLEAGLPLYGHDIGETTTPVEANLAWSIGKRRRAERNFPGAAAILAQLEAGAPRRLVGIRPEGQAPAREGTEVFDAAGRAVGRITSGGFGPTVGGPVAMGYVAAESARPGTALVLSIRGRPHPARIAALPFVPHRYHRQ